MGKTLENHVSVVAGGASGIGRAIALEYAMEGAKVVIADVREDPSEGGASTAELIESAGGSAIFVKTDVSLTEDVENLVNVTDREFGGASVIVNSAGIPMKKSLSETSVSDFDQMYGVTVRGTFLTCKLFLPDLMKSSSGRIINIASNFSFTALPEMSAYASAKAAIIGLTKTLALELGPHGINVNAVSPGATRTEMSRPFWGTESGLSLLERRVPLRKSGKFVSEPEDVAKLALFLASEDSRMITGESILVDGGWNAE